MPPLTPVLASPFLFFHQLGNSGSWKSLNKPGMDAKCQAQYRHPSCTVRPSGLQREKYISHFLSSCLFCVFFPHFLVMKNLKLSHKLKQQYNEHHRLSRVHIWNILPYLFYLNINVYIDIYLHMYVSTSFFAELFRSCRKHIFLKEILLYSHIIISKKIKSNSLISYLIIF